jgi:hypothetical protein
MKKRKKKRTWHHYTIVYKNNHVTIYRDGKKTDMTIDFWYKELTK